MGRGELVSQTMLPLEELRLEWLPPKQLSCTAIVPRQPLGSDPPTHLDIHLSFNLLEAPGNVSDSNLLLLRMGTRAAEGGGGRLRAHAEVPQGLLQSSEGSGSGLWRVMVRARLLWQKGSTKGDFEHGPQLESRIVVPCAEVSQGDVPPPVRAGCVGAIQKAAQEAQGSEQADTQTVLRQLLMAWRYRSQGDEATWLNYCGLPEDQAQALLKEWLVDPLEFYVGKLREYLAVDTVSSTPSGLWEAWDAGQRTLEAWKLIGIKHESMPPANGNVGVALEMLQKELEELVASAWQAIEKPVQEPLLKINYQVLLEEPDMESLWRTRGESRVALTNWSQFRVHVALMQDSGGEQAEIGNRLSSAIGELRKSLVIAEDVLVQDLETKVEAMHSILKGIQAADEMSNPKLHADAVQTAIVRSQTVLRVWSSQEEHAQAFWDALLALGALQQQEAQQLATATDVWAVWARGFHAVFSWKKLGQTNPSSCTENETFKALLDELIECLSELIIASLKVLPRTLSYPLVMVDDQVGADFGKVHIGGYEALQLCITNQTQTVLMAREGGACGKLGWLLVDFAAQLQEHVLADIHSTSADLEMASVEEAKEVAELIEALNSLDFDLTRWNFMRPCVAQMSMSPGVVGEMMRRLLGLADKVRAARDAKDLQHIHGCTSRTLAGKAANVVPASAQAVDVTHAFGSSPRVSTHSESSAPVILAPGMEIKVGYEYHQVKTTGLNIGLVARLRDTVDVGAEICRLEVSPLGPNDSMPRGFSQAFVDSVENFNCQKQTPADEIVKRHYGWLPTDVKARKIALLAMYTVNTLYCEVNRALYENDRQLLYDNAGYIRELRDVFLVGQSSPIVEPFIGSAVRSSMVESHRLQAFSAQFEAGQVHCWTSFTSTSDAKCGCLDGNQLGAAQLELKGRHAGNVTFVISCGKTGPPLVGQYFPSLVKAFSAFSSEDEVIFPPHCFFRVVNMETKEASLRVEMETLEFPDVWQLIREEDWTKFEAWASRNAELVDTRTRTFSMIGAIADSISKPLDKGELVPNPFGVCVRCGADVNEVSAQETPLAKLERKLAQAGSSEDIAMYTEWVSSLRKLSETSPKNR